MLDTTSMERRRVARERIEIARALGLMLEPIVDLCLETGLSSPEFETLVRAVFVQRAIRQLPPTRRLGKPASDVRVGLAVGLHRNEVRKIRSAKGYAGMAKRQRRHRMGRLIGGWTSDSKFTTSGGQPRDLPLSSDDGSPTFEDLAHTYLPGISAGSALRELRRHSLIQILPDEIIRLRSLMSRPAGMSAESIQDACRILEKLVATVHYNLRNTGSPRLHLETRELYVRSERLPIIRAVMERRAKTFVQALDKELRVESLGRRGRGKKRIGISVLASEAD